MFNKFIDTIIVATFAVVYIAAALWAFLHNDNSLFVVLVSVPLISLGFLVLTKAFFWIIDWLAGNGWLSKVKAFLADPFLLNVWGSEYTARPARFAQKLFTLILAAVFVFEIIPWTLWWSLIFSEGSERIMALVLGLVITAVMVIVERMIVTYDTDTTLDVAQGLDPKLAFLKKAGGFVGRVLVLLVAMYLVSIPYQLRVFHDEIEQRITEQELEGVAKVRDAEIRRIRQRYSSTASTAPGLIAAKSAERAQDLRDLRTQRASGLVPLLVELRRLEDRAAMEAAGKGPSGHYGTGPAHKAMLDQARVQRQAVQDYNDETLRLVREHQAATKRALAALDVDFERKILEVQTMDDSELLARYGTGATVKIKRGFLKRYETLELLEAEDKSGRVAHIRGLLELMVFFFGMIVVLAKLLAPREWKTACSTREQAVGGNTAAMTELARRGFDVSPVGLVMLGLDRDQRQLVREHLKLRSELSNEIVTFLNEWLQAVNLATQTTSQNPYNVTQEVVWQISPLWEAIRGKMAELTMHEQTLREQSISISAWPTDLAIKVDPRYLECEPWKLRPEDFLAFFGRHDPLEGLRKARVAYHEAEEQLERLAGLISWRDRWIEYYAKHDLLNEQDLRTLVKRHYDDYFAPVMRRLEELGRILHRQHRFRMPPVPHLVPGLSEVERLRNVADWEIEQYREASDEEDEKPPRSISYL